MKKILLISFLSIFITAKSYAGPDGKGELQLSERALNSFVAYLKGDTSNNSKAQRNKPLVFWVAVDGSKSFWWYCGHNSCRPGNSSQERVACEEATGLDCKRFARRRTVSWDNGINRKGNWTKFNSKMNKSEIKKKLETIGFYNNSIKKETDFLRRKSVNKDPS